MSYFTRKKKKQIPKKAGRHRITERYPSRVKRKHDRNLSFYYPQVSSPGSDADNDGIEPAPGFASRTVRTRAPCGALCRLWATLLRSALQFV